MNTIFLTVDIECHDIRKENQYIWGKKNGKEYGIGRILELGKEYKIPINFFLDFAEEKRYGREFIQRIVDKIRSYGHPIFLHLHPNFITGDDKRTFLWEYSKEEQKIILKEGIDIYHSVMGEYPHAFRAGRYGVDKDTYDLLDELMPNIIECSYLGGRDGKMCHVDETVVKTRGNFSTYKSLKVVPNCGFVAFDLCGKRKSVGVDASEMSLVEFKEFLKEANNRDFILTMHSWNFIDRLFWSSSYVGNHKTNERLFKGIVKMAKENGYTFDSIEGCNFEDGCADEYIRYNACNTFWKKIRSFFLNFWRFQQMAKISKKYMIIYSMFYTILIVVVILLLKIVLLK